MDGFIYAPNEEVKFSADSAYLPVNTGGCELTNLPLEQVSSNQAIWASSSFGSTIIDSSQVLGFNSVPEQDLNHFSMQNATSLNNLQHQTNLNGGGLLTDQKDLNAINGLNNLSSFSSGSQMAFQTLHMPHQGTSHLMNQLPADATRVTGTSTGTGIGTCTSIGTGTGTGFDGTFKPRVRARRGQATDPHSIAERLRREKISERMKNLQELVPNSNRTDKASMLDEIIDYVKFLQLQVKLLSMSRLGATEAVVPLLTESQNEGSTSNLTSVSIKSNSSEHESTTFEQEVIRLMESNVTSAMQYLQNKGLCLMPIALASAISTQKGTHTAAIPTQRRNSGSNLDYVSLYEDVSGGGTN